jgi:urease accessory protein
METFEIIHFGYEDPPKAEEEVIVLAVDRATLAKRRWRGVAPDGREFGFDLDDALEDGAVFHREAGKCYLVSQATEPLLEIDLGSDPGRAARIAWQVGNLHFPVEINDLVIRCADDPAIRHLLGRTKVAWRVTCAVFRPSTSAGHAHHHH